MPLGTSPLHHSDRQATPLLPLLVTAAAVVCALAYRPSPCAADGVPLAPSVTEAQSAPVVSPDGRGAAIVSYKTSASRAGAVHVGPDGVADQRLTFSPLTLPFELEPAQPLRAQASGDSAVLFVADLAQAGGPAVTRLRDQGVPVAGQPVSLAMPLRRPAIVPGANGRTLLIAMDADATSFWTLRIAVLAADGLLESAVELPSTRQFFYGDVIAACSDGAGGILAAMPYYDAAVTGSKDVGIFRYAADGSRPWGDTVRPLAIAARDQVDVQVVPDGVGGMLIAWTDPRVIANSNDIYAHRVDSFGQRNEDFGFYGTPICSAPGVQSQPRMIGDGTGGAWIVWYDQRASLDGDLRFSHLLGDGTLAAGFTNQGSVLCDAPGVQREAAIAGDGAGGLFVVWRDERSGDADVYAQHIAANGSPAAGWDANGRAVVVAAGAQDQPAIASVRAGRAVVAWRDARAGAATRIYTSALVDAATTAVPPAPASSVRLSAERAMHGAAVVRVTLPTASNATLELLDVTGRRLVSTRLQGPLSGERVSLGDALLPGLYFARLRSADATAHARLTVTR
ncbi:MAG: hypothetical protein K8R56_03915 [Candidatus Eisenbacteria bacterium]|nr:hypothetical protein [Candidatus Eisenbacteria bacterium]